MADIDADAIWALSDALAVEPTTEQRTASATVSRIDNDGTIWVRLAGAESATPVNGGCTVEVEPNDAVTVRIENGRCAITGSTSKPATNSAAVESRVAPVENTAMDAKSEATTARKIANEAANVAAATGQYFWHDENGAHVSIEAQNPTGASNSVWNSLGLLIRKAANNLVSITASAIAFFDGNGNADSNIVARFGADGAQIGKSGAAHSIIDANGQRFYGGSNGTTQLANIGYGQTATESGTTTSLYYTFGTRAANSTIGAKSLAEGNDVTASGRYSHAEGQETIASGHYGAHAEGFYTHATGDSSHAQNMSTRAVCHAQTVIGTYNVEDDPTITTHPNEIPYFGSYALIVGNGTSNSDRHNAFTVSWDGSAFCYKELNAQTVRARTAFKIGNTEITDFVVEQGTSGIWTYRKWSSGIAECWGRYSGSIAVNVAAAAYGGYRSAQITVPLPSGFFTAAPRVTGTFTSAQGIWLNNMAGTTASNVLFYLSSGTSYTAATRYVDIHAFGNWK